MGTLTATGRRRKDLHAVVRQRAATLFDPPLHRPDAHPEAGPPPGAGTAPPAPAPELDPALEPGRELPGAGSGPSSRREAWRAALVERLPMWLYVRCGIEWKTVAALAVVLVAAVGFAVHHFWTGRPQTIAVPPATHNAVSTATPAPSPGPPARAPAAAGTKGAVVVDVAGEVRKPGVRRLPIGSRVTDALEAAGGALPDTDTSALNLARVLADGEQVLVGAPAPASGTGPGPPGAPGGSPAPISLNAATVEQLDTLPGVGPVLAQHILAYRTQHGGFTSVAELQDVNGIGERRFSDLEPLVQP